MPRKPAMKSKPKKKKTGNKRYSQNVGKHSNSSTMNNIETKQFTVSTTKLGATTITGANASASNYMINEIQDLPNYATYLNLFDRYLIRRVKATFKWVDTNDSSSTQLANYRTPQIYMRYNYDSNAANGNQAPDLYQAKRFVMTPQQQMVSYSWVPKTVSPVYLSAVSTGYKENPPQWIDGSYTSVPHYGLSYYIDYIPADTQIIIDLELSVSFKNKL